MASTKALLREFGKNSARLAFPSKFDKVIWLTNNQEAFTNYTPPSDGWLFVRGKGKYISAEVLKDKYIGILSSKHDGLWGASLYPCSKGDPVSYVVFGYIEDYWICFIPAKLAE